MNISRKNQRAKKNDHRMNKKRLDQMEHSHYSQSSRQPEQSEKLMEIQQETGRYSKLIDR